MWHEHLNKKDGYGTYTDADGDKYVGEQWESRITAQPFTDAAAAVGERLS